MKYDFLLLIGYIVRRAIVAEIALSVKQKPAPVMLRRNGFSMVAGARFELATLRLCIPLQLSLLRHKTWRICSLDYILIRNSGPLPFSLYTFPPQILAGLARYYLKLMGFTEFDKLSFSRYRLRSPKN